MKAVLGYVGIGIACLALLFGLTWASQGNEFFLYKYFAPKQEAVRRQVFEQSRAFNQGMVQELENMQMQYVAAKEPDAKAAMADIILHRASGYNMDDPVVPLSLRSFVQGLKNERLGTSGRSFE
jgi:hypothetical protein